MTTTSDSRRKDLVLGLCCLGQFMVVLDVSVVNIALPAIRSSLGFSAADLQWVVNAYSILFGSFLLLGGRAVDLFDSRHVFIAAFALFSGASLLCGLSDTPLTLILARAAQGLGAAILAPTTLSILNRTFTDARERHRAIGWWAACGSMGGTAGGLIGGVLIDAASWRWVFLVNVPIGVLAVLVARAALSADDASKRDGRQLDVAGALTVFAGLVALVYAVTRTSIHGWTSAAVLAPMAAGLLLIGLFLLIETRIASQPLLPLRIFRRRSLTLANWAMLCLGFSMIPMWYFVTLYLQEVLGLGPLTAGLAYLPMVLLIALIGRLGGGVAARVGYGVTLTVGLVGLAVGLGLFAFAPMGADYASAVMPRMMIIGLSLGLAFMSAAAAGTAGVDAREIGLASGLINTSRQIGGALGLAVLTAIAATRSAALLAGGTPETEATLDGFHHAFAGGAAVALLGAAFSARLIRDGVGRAR